MRTQTLIRSVNETMVASARQFGSDTASVICECAVAACFERMYIPLEAYEDVRRDGARFVLVPGHESAASEEIVHHQGDFLVVEVRGEAAQMARDLDPRR